MTDDKDGIMRDAGDTVAGNNGGSIMTPMDITTTGDAPRVHQCCGCCCDMRKAVLIVDSIYMGLAIVSAFYALAAEEHLVTFNKPGNAAKVENFPEEEWSDYVADSTLLKFGIATSFISVIFYATSIVGALRFRWKFILPLPVWVAVTAFVTFVLELGFCSEWESTEAGQSVIDEWDCRKPPAAHIVNWVAFALFCYPHVALMWQYRRQRVTRETYPQQKSCCGGCFGMVSG